MTNRKPNAAAFWLGHRMSAQTANEFASAYWRQRERESMGDPDAFLGQRMPTRTMHDADNEVPSPFTCE